MMDLQPFSVDGRNCDTEMEPVVNQRAEDYTKEVFIAKGTKEKEYLIRYDEDREKFIGLYTE